MSSCRATNANTNEQAANGRGAHGEQVEEELREALEATALRVLARRLEGGELDAECARIRALAVKSGHTMDRGPVVERECAACSSLACLVPEALARFAAGLEGGPTVPELERLAAPMVSSRAPFPPPSPDRRDELLHRTLAALEVVFLTESRAGANVVIEELHDEIVAFLSDQKSTELLHVAPREKLVSSTRVEYRGSHATIDVWNRGGHAGRLTVDAKDARYVAARLEGHAWRDEAIGASLALEEAASSLERLAGVLRDELRDEDYGSAQRAVLEPLAEELEGAAAAAARNARKVRA